MSSRPFKQIDVFSTNACRGNPLAVVLDAGGLDDETMQRFAAWTNLSETTFVLPPTSPAADYLVRIFTPSRELPFAGHPTLGSCHAWLEAGGLPRKSGTIVQQCGAGLIPIHQNGSRLAFGAPPLLKSGPLDDALLDRLLRGFGLTAATITAHHWLINGPPWIGLLLPDAEAVLALRPDYGILQGLDVGVIGPWPAGSECAFEIRAFPYGDGPYEDPVTGSFNAGVAQWLIGAGIAPPKYTAAQGTALGRAGRVYVEQHDDVIWIGGESRTLVDGQVTI